jgi:hypothetical protein
MSFTHPTARRGLVVLPLALFALAWLAGAGTPGARCPVVVTSFGAVPDDGADDLPAFAAATSAAQARGVALEVPPGKFDLVYRPGTPNMIPVAAGRLKVVGAGRGLTVLQFGPERPTGEGTLNVWAIADGCDAEFTDLTIVGPTDPGPDGSKNAITNAFHVPDATLPGSLRLERVEVLGNLFESIEVEAGAGLAPYLCELRDCYLTNASQNIAFFGPDGGDRQLRCFGVTFGHSGLYPTDPGYPSGHSLYVHPCNSYLVEACRWVDPQKFVIHHFSGGGRSVAPRYARILDCDFGPGCTGGMVLGNLGLTQWRGGKYAGSGGVYAQGPLSVAGVDFDPLNPSFSLSAMPGFAPDVVLTGCTLKNNFRAEANLGRWTFQDCTATRGVAPGSPQGVPIQAIGGDVLVRGGRYSGATPPQVSTPVASATAGRLAIDGITVDGVYDYYAGTPAILFSGTAVGRVDRSTFNTPSVPIGTEATLAAGALVGTGNLFAGGQPNAPGQALSP